MQDAISVMKQHKLNDISALLYQMTGDDFKIA